MKTPVADFELYTGSSVRNQDDIQSLRQHLPGGDFRYVDVTAEQRLAEALKRWPLMSELRRLTQRPDAVDGEVNWPEKTN